MKIREYRDVKGEENKWNGGRKDNRITQENKKGRIQLGRKN